ncbi:MAG: pyridoxal phosphate-dependent aminotransferase, partial [Bradymonadaceae bacterium]
RRCLERGVREATARPYRTDAAGLAVAREAVSAYYDRRGVAVDTEDLVLTASTSEAYSWLLKIASRPGGKIAVPTPSYPLFEHLVRLESAVPERYRLARAGRWRIDPASLSRLAEGDDAVDLVFAVNPNNPTGHALSDTDLELLADRASEADALLVVDEVFLDYHLGHSRAASVTGRLEDVCGGRQPPTVVLSGLSKVAAAPGAKMSWMVLAGPESCRRGAAERLAFVADNYLSLTPATQRAAPGLLEAAEPFQQSLRERLSTNLQTVARLAEDCPPCTRYPVDAGWYQPLRFPALLDERELVLDLLAERATAVEPGFLFEFDADSHIVISLLPEPDRFERGLRRVFEHVAEQLGAP